MEHHTSLDRDVQELREELARQRSLLRRQQCAMLAAVIGCVGFVLLGAAQAPPAAPAGAAPPNTVQPGAVPPGTVPLVPADAAFGVVTCREVRIVDASGKIRVRLGSAAGGAAGVEWLAPDGRRRMWTETAADGSPSLALSDAAGTSRLTASVSPQGDAAMQWFDADRRMRMNAASQSNGMVGVYWWDTNDRQRMPRITAETGRNGNVVFPTLTGR